MKLENLSIAAQDGLRRLGKEWENDELLFDALASNHESWAWWYFRLREMEDRPEWFPKGKWATLQAIEQLLTKEAKQFALAAFR